MKKLENVLEKIKAPEQMQELYSRTNGIFKGIEDKEGRKGGRQDHNCPLECRR